MPRNDLTLADKIDLLDQIHSQPSNTSHRKLAKITGVPKSTIARVMSQQEELREEWELSGELRKSRKRKREGKHPDVEEALNSWFSTVTAWGVHVNGAMLKTKSEELAKRLGHPNFKATGGWLSRWKSRNAITLQKTPCEDRVEQSTKLASLLQTFSPDDIYNADETDLLYRATPDGFLSYNHESVSCSNKATDRVTVLCCTNMSGSDKRKLLVIGKLAKPRCFTGFTMESLPVLYHANKSAQMTSHVFQKWLSSWDEELQQKSRKIVLLLDDCAVHHHFDCLENIQLEFLPSNTTPPVHPLQRGIVRTLKTLYRGRLVHFILEAIEDNLLTSSSTAEEVSAKVTILEAVQFMADSWREVSSKTIQDSFALYGSKSFDQVMLDTDNVVFSQLERVTNFEEFLSIDDSRNSHHEDSVQIIVDQHPERLEDHESDVDDSTKHEKVSNQEARNFIAQLRHYFMQKGCEGSPLSALDMCSDFVRLQSIKQNTSNYYR